MTPTHSKHSVRKKSSLQTTDSNPDITNRGSAHTARTPGFRFRCIKLY